MIGQEAQPSVSGSTSSVFKVAVVDIQELFKGYRKTLLAEREIDLARAEIQKKSQLATNEILNKKKVAEKRIMAMREGKLSEEETQNLQREIPVLKRELQMAEQIKMEQRNQANQKLNQQMVRRMAGILEEIVKLTAKRAEEEGFDLVVDSSGDNSSQVPPMLFARDAIDITAIMKKELSKAPSGGR